MRAWDWIFLLLLAAVFTPAVLSLAHVWTSLDYYSHGFLVPVVAAWAATGQRAVLPRLPVERSPRGLLGVAGALFVYLTGLLLTDPTLQGLALVGAVASALYTLRGPAWLRALRFPVAFLLFMVPIPPALLTPVIVNLQLFVSAVGVQIVRALGFAALRNGNVIELTSGETLFVAEACSGITSLVTLLPLAVFLAYFTERTLGRQLVLVASVLPLAMAGNLLRVVGTVVAAERWGVGAATSGPTHEWAGVLTYVLGCLALLAVGALMRWISPEKNPQPAR